MIAKNRLISASEEGRKKVIIAAKLLEDSVVMARCSSNDCFKYHSSKKQKVQCYKKFILAANRLKERSARHNTLHGSGSQHLTEMEDEDTVQSRDIEPLDHASSNVEPHTPSALCSRCKVPIEGYIPQEEDNNRKGASSIGGKTRSSSSSSSAPIQPKVCVICNRERGSTKHRPRQTFRLCQKKRAQLFLDAMNFNMDDVKIRCSLYETPGDLFAADVETHNTCMKEYLEKYNRRLEALSKHIQTREEQMVLDKVSIQVFESLDLTTCGYPISSIRDLINESHDEANMDNRKVKILLVKHFGDKICFTYPHDRKLSQMVFSNMFSCSTVVETLRSHAINKVKSVADELRSEVKAFDFGLDDSICNGDDVNLSMDKYKSNRPKKWLEFVRYLFPGRSTTESECWLLKFDTVFQVLFYWMTNCKMTPLHCSLAHTLHSLSKSRQLLEITNRHGLTVSYHTMKRIDTTIANKMVNDTLPYRCPVSKKINDIDLIQGAIDNFDHSDNTLSGKDTTHDTVMVVFQNRLKSEAELTSDTSDVISDTKRVRARKFVSVLPCQQLIESKLSKGSSEITGSSTTTAYSLKDSKNSECVNADNDYFAWSLGRKLLRSDQLLDDVELKFPNFPSTQSCLQEPNKFQITTTSFTPILPFKATEMDSIFTSMINFNDVLEQRAAKCGALWCNEGVYQVAKEIQLLKPELFGHLFIGLGPFHTDKIVISCLGKFLGISGIDHAMVESMVFGKGVVEGSVMNGGDYVKGKSGMALVAEVMNTFLFKQFIEEEVQSDNELQDILEEVEKVVTDALEDLDNGRGAARFSQSWESLKMTQTDLHFKFRAWKETSGRS